MLPDAIVALVDVPRAADDSVVRVDDSVEEVEVDVVEACARCR